MTTESLTRHDRLPVDEDFLRLLTGEVADAVHRGHAYSVVAVVPQHLEGEGVSDIVQVAVSAIRGLMRREDVAGLHNGATIVVGLNDADGISAQVFGHRLQSDLRLRSYHMRNTVWEPGYATLHRNGETARELIAAAVDSAKNRRRHIAEA